MVATRFSPYFAARCRQSQEFRPQRRIYWSSFSKLNIGCTSLQTPVTLLGRASGDYVGTRNNCLGLEHRPNERLGAVRADAQPFLSARDRRHAEADDE